MPGAKRDYSRLPGWPRLLSRDLAAAYLGISASTLDGPRREAVRIGSRRARSWVDAQRTSGWREGSIHAGARILQPSTATGCDDTAQRIQRSPLRGRLLV